MASGCATTLMSRPASSPGVMSSIEHSESLTCINEPSVETSAMPIAACVNALWKRLSLAFIASRCSTAAAASCLIDRCRK